MKNSDLIHIDRLIADEHFRSVIESLADHELIPDQLVASYHQYSKVELEFARQMILAAKKDQGSVDDGNKKKIWESIDKTTAQYDRDKNAPEINLKVHKKQIAWKKFIGYAAVFIGLVFLITWNFMDQNRVNDRIEISEEMVRKTNPTGQKSRITLPDGSIVHLNAESELVYDKNFIGDQRKLYLVKGEAYFHVNKNKEKPFIVIIDDIIVTALGTEFNVNAFNEDLKVALVEGSVLVNNTSGNDHLIMRPSEVLEFDPIANRLKITSGHAQDFADWKEQILHFNDTPIDEAFKTLSRWYAVEFSLENTPPGGLTVSGKFNNSSLELVLNNLSYSLDFEYNTEEKNIILKFKK